METVKTENGFLELEDKTLVVAPIKINGAEFFLQLRKPGPLFTDEMAKIEIYEREYQKLQTETRELLENKEADLESKEALLKRIKTLADLLMNHTFESLRLIVINQDEFEKLKRSKDWLYQDLVKILDYIVIKLTEKIKSTGGPVKKNRSSARRSKKK